ncbi:rod shape-determining protein MreC [Desulfosarcina sp. BuS5]|uniref:rod shape-determining protein MreC n=1 Tax=Desulfosarcina sp. BuS5 TaxID=933262 RepID=UPI000554C6E6|nr:rod shape-determining protein MreC [Desulfosarcina sp. BuS5]WDN89917.1 rod shape-determining protein MreC [Desulfosarcina sp. BuS5]
MFSKKTVVIIGLIIMIVANIVALSITSRYPFHEYGRLSIFIMAPFQDAISNSLKFLESIWNNYFNLISVANENRMLKKELSNAIERNNFCYEAELSNIRLRHLLNFKKTLTDEVIAAEVIGKDPSAWFQTIIIDKGNADGILRGLPVVVPDGIAGQVTDVAEHYSKVLLITDGNSAVDTLVQRTRARGLLQGGRSGLCILKYALRKEDVVPRDTVVTSGLDGVFPKGLRIGYVSKVIKRNSGLFQEVDVTPYVDFEKLEEVMVILNKTNLTGIETDVKD